MPESESSSPTHEVRIIVSSLGNERRTVVFQDQTTEEAQRIVNTINASFGTIRTNEALLLTGSDGQAVFVNLSNVAFIEVQVV